MTSVDVEFGLTALAAMVSPMTLTFAVLSLVLAERPLRTGLWFFLGAFSVTVIMGVAGSLLVGGDATSSNNSSTPETWVAIVDIALGALLVVLVVRTLHRPRDPKRTADAIEKMTGLVSSPAIAVIAAGATLANPGAFIPIALKDISQLNPSTAEYVLYWAFFGAVSLLPLLAALAALILAREWTMSKLHGARGWLEIHARTLAAVILLLLAAALLRNGVVGLTG